MAKHDQQLDRGRIQVERTSRKTGEASTLGLHSSWTHATLPTHWPNRHMRLGWGAILGCKIKRPLCVCAFVQPPHILGCYAASQSLAPAAPNLCATALACSRLLQCGACPATAYSCAGCLLMSPPTRSRHGLTMWRASMDPSLPTGEGVQPAGQVRCTACL